MRALRWMLVLTLLGGGTLLLAYRSMDPERRTLDGGPGMSTWGESEAMARGQLADFLHPERHPDWVERYRAQQRFVGTREALRRTRAAIASDPDQAPLLRALGAQPRPVMVVWGRLDPVAPFAGSGPLLAAMPRAVFVPVDSAAHLPHLERPGIVVPAVVRFLRSGPAAPPQPSSSSGISTQRMR